MSTPVAKRNVNQPDPVDSGRPRTRADSRPRVAREPKKKIVRIPHDQPGILPGQRQGSIPATSFNDGKPYAPEPHTEEWYALAFPPPIPDGQPRRAPPPPPGYRYRMDGVLTPLIDPRLDLSTPEGQQTFLDVLQFTGSQRAAMDAVGVASYRTVERHLTDNPEFLEKFEASVQRHKDAIYQAAYTRSVHGYLKPIVGGKDKDEIVTYERVYSDALTALLLKRHFVEFRQADQRGGATVNVNTTTNVVQLKEEVGRKIRNMTREQRMAMRSLLKPAEQQELDAEIVSKMNTIEAHGEDVPRSPTTEDE